MKKHRTLRKKRILRKNRTLKQRKNAQFRHYTRQSSLSSKMKGRGRRDNKHIDYIAYRKDQLKRVNDIWITWTAIQYNRGIHKLQPKLGRLTHFLEDHIKNIPLTREQWNIWSDRGQHIDAAIDEINNLNQCIGRTDDPIPIINNEQVLKSRNICYEDDPDENDPDENSIRLSTGITTSSRGITKRRTKSASARMLASRGL